MSFFTVNPTSTTSSGFTLSGANPSQSTSSLGEFSFGGLGKSLTTSTAGISFLSTTQSSTSTTAAPVTSTQQSTALNMAEFSFGSIGLSTSTPAVSGQPATPFSSTTATVPNTNFNLGGDDHGHGSSAKSPVEAELNENITKAVTEFQKRLSEMRTLRDECQKEIRKGGETILTLPRLLHETRELMCGVENNLAPLMVNSERVRLVLKSLKANCVTILGESGEMIPTQATERLFRSQVIEIREKIEDCEKRLQRLETTICDRTNLVSTKDKIKQLYKRLICAAADVQSLTKDQSS
ncbi:hypothetical protein ACOME3_007629 [Neoechinorhynchus agilis]